MTEGPQAGTKPTFDEFKAALESYGAYTDEALKELKWEDLERLGVPPLLARQIANEILRAASPQVAYRSPKSVARLATPDLLAAYSAERTNSAEAKELNSRYGNRRILVFKTEDGSIDIDNSMQQISLWDHDLPEVEYLQDGRKVYSIGDGPARMIDVCPIHTGELLVNGFCQKCRIMWGETVISFRQFIYFAVRRGLVSSSDRFLIRSMFERGNKGHDNIAELHCEYPEAMADFEEAQRKGELPTLKTKIGGGSNGGNPFGKNRQY
jgi:hypothetical protein